MLKTVRMTLVMASQPTTKTSTVADDGITVSSPRQTTAKRTLVAGPATAIQNSFSHSFGNSESRARPPRIHSVMDSTPIS
jgi:hypothetical protein